MSLRFRHLQALAMASALALSACSDTGPNFEGNFDAAATSASVQTIDAAYSTPAFQSFAALGGQFVVGGGVPAASARLIQAAAQSVTMTDQAKIAADQIANAIAAPAAILIPEEYRKQTYTYNGEAYVVNPDRADEAPDTGVRFILYAVNPVTGEITDGLEEIGYVDLIDLSNDTQASVQLVVASGGVTYLDYTVTATGVITAPTFTIDGYITDGDNQVDFTLVAGYVSTFASVTLTIDYDISVGDFSVSADLELVTDGEEGASVTVDVTFTHLGHTVRVFGGVENDMGTLQVTANGQLFATITFTDTQITVVGADGEALDQDEINALRELTEMIEDVFDAFEHLFHPVEFLFSGPQS
ncbi:MAG: hypothetical protein JSW51_10760 [Gemmatimonadota bacterium]|nr:MAG: hypothetical protein JSW51_10760 [Gemmatimonadota bacterium]